MKTYKNLWDKFISIENFDLAVKKAIKSKKSIRSVQYLLTHCTESIQQLRDDLIHGNFKTSRYQTFTIYEPKKRGI